MPYPGGAGTCRAYDEETYVYSEDPHLHGLTFAMGRFQNGKRVFGLGGSATHIDIASFVEGANLNDARNWKVGGQIQSRPDTPWNNLKAILQAGGATPVLIGGVISCINRTPRVSLATITHRDIVGDCSFTNTQPRRARINTVIPMYRSEAHDWQMVSAKAVSAPEYVAQDGDERTREIQFPLVQDVEQVSKLAAYEVADAREAGPGSIPLGPWWLNYKIGDCVTFSPEDGLAVKVMITGRGIEPQSGVVTYDVKSETDAKHPYALGQTGTAPPTASLQYDIGVPVPAEGDWTFTGATLTANGFSIPAIVAVGAIGNPSADAVLFDYRPHVSDAGAEDGWISAGIEAAGTTKKEVAGVTPGTAYDLSVRYRVRGALSDRRILGPVNAGVLANTDIRAAARASRHRSAEGPLPTYLRGSRSRPRRPGSRSKVASPTPRSTVGSDLMACQHIALPGGGSAIVCGTRRRQRCVCGRPATLECDWKVTTTKSGTCDAPICARCTTSPAPGMDLCTTHVAAFNEWMAGR